MILCLIRRLGCVLRRCVFVSAVSVTLLFSAGVVSSAYADDAPVYDADNYPPFDGQADGGAELASPSPALPNTQSSAARIARLEQQVAALQSVSSTEKLDALQADVQSLRGQLEQLSHQLQQLQSQQRAEYTDLDRRLSETKGVAEAAKNAVAASVAVIQSKETTPTLNAKPHVSPVLIPARAKTIKKAVVNPAVTATTNTVSSVAVPSKTPVNSVKPAQPNVQEEQRTYQTAYDFIRAEKYDQAIVTLQKMLAKYPSGQFAANAHYWLGELYGLQGKNAQSAAEFQIVIKNYSDSPKIADANLKLALIYAAEQKWDAARAVFKRVINHYPGTASARLANEQLKQLKLAGH